MFIHTYIRGVTSYLPTDLIGNNKTGIGFLCHFATMLRAAQLLHWSRYTAKHYNIIVVSIFQFYFKHIIIFTSLSTINIFIVKRRILSSFKTTNFTLPILIFDVHTSLQLLQHACRISKYISNYNLILTIFIYMQN